MRTRATVVQSEEEPVEREVLATAIVRISESVQRLRKSGLNEKAIVALIKDGSTGLSKGQIKTVLECLDSLARDYCR
jgi:hypothetical protein